MANKFRRVSNAVGLGDDCAVVKFKAEREGESASADWRVAAYSVVIPKSDSKRICVEGNGRKSKFRAGI